MTEEFESSTLDQSSEMERTPLTSQTPSQTLMHESLRVRCPDCNKLYMVQFSDIQEAKPRFECVQCRTRFWLSLNDMDITADVIGIPLSAKDVPETSKKPVDSRATEPCPKCAKPVESGQTECGSCGVVVEKFKAALNSSDGAPPRSSTLESAWKRLVSSYEDESLHSEFIRACQRERNLAYAGAQYAQMQKLMPTDESTQNRLREVQALIETMLPRIEKRMPPLSAVPYYPRLWQVPLLVAAMLMIAGMMLPAFRQMVGIGAAFLFVAVAIQVHFRRR